MIFEALVWLLRSIGEGVEAVADMAIPAEWTAFYRGAIADWGLPIFGALSRFVAPAALGVLGGVATVGFALVVTAIIARWVRAVRSWLP